MVRTFYVEHHELFDKHFAVCEWVSDSLGNEYKKFILFCKKSETAHLIAIALNEDEKDGVLEQND